MENSIEIIKDLLGTLEDAKNHLEFCSYGDNYERDCARDLPQHIDSSISKAKKFLSEIKA